MAWPEWMIDAYLRKLLRPIRDRLDDILLAPVGDSIHLALLSSCGLHLDDDVPFDLGKRGDPSYRKVPTDVDPQRLKISHGHYDESGVCEDFEIALPVTAVGCLVDEGVVASLHPVAYSFRGFFYDVVGFMDDHTREVADDLEVADVSAALITPC